MVAPTEKMVYKRAQFTASKNGQMNWPFSLLQFFHFAILI